MASRRFIQTKRPYRPFYGFPGNLVTLLGFAVNRFVLLGCTEYDNRHTASRMPQAIRPTVAARKRRMRLSSWPNLAEQRGDIRKADKIHLRRKN